MKIDVIEISGFMSSAKANIQVPAVGLVQVTGSNGAGKSTLVEAVSYCLWGKTIRGTSPWSGDVGYVEVTCGDLVVRREKRKAKVSLMFSVNGETTKYETNTKAQAALEAIVGSWDVWRRSSVFTSTDAAHFSTATDADRKRLLESVLGIDKFDVALAACRADSKALGVDVAAAHRTRDVAAETVRGLLDRLRDAQAALDSATNPGPAPASADDIQVRMRALTELVTGIGAEISGLSQQKAQHEFAHTVQRNAVDKQRFAIEKATGLCPTCKRPLDARGVESMRAELEALTAALASSEPRIAKVIRALDDDIDDLRVISAGIGVQLGALDVERAVVAQAVKLHAAQLKAFQSAAKHYADVSTGVNASRATLAKHEATLKVLDYKLRLLLAADKALGTKGIRAHVLHRAIAGLEKISNAWLSRISDGKMSLKLSSYSETSTGAVKDAISLSVAGLGGDGDYHGTSGGERRRVDVALVLGLGEMVSGASSMPGTVFADEVFDALDVDGVAAVADALRDLATDRCVVVITHSPEMIGSLKADQSWNVRSGQIKTS